jgi:hypothetical protein
MVVGAAEDAPKQADLPSAVAKMELARLAGFEAIRFTSWWTRGKVRPSAYELLILQNAADAAALTGMRVYLAVYNAGSRHTPRTARARAQFAAYAASLARALPSAEHVVVGNEPNLNRYWLPQFRGTRSASPASYLALLARTYDALKGVDPAIEVIGGAVSPRGGDNPQSRRHTHSPTRFLLELGQAYRRSGRSRPIMDAFALHPYLPSSKQPPTVRHPRSTTITIADYPKLTSLLGRAFRGTAQPWRLPIVYGEFGVQSAIPPAKRDVYTNHNLPVSKDAVSEAVQAQYYRQALALAYCQPRVSAFLIFHVMDERDLGRWQSGVYYADETPKTSLPAVRKAVTDVADGQIARCGAR